MFCILSLHKQPEGWGGIWLPSLLVADLMLQLDCQFAKLGWDATEERGVLNTLIKQTIFSTNKKLESQKIHPTTHMFHLCGPPYHVRTCMYTQFTCKSYLADALTFNDWWMAANGFGNINQDRVGASQLHGPVVDSDLWLALLQNCICSPYVCIGCFGVVLLFPLPRNMPVGEMATLNYL